LRHEPSSVERLRAVCGERSRSHYDRQSRSVVAVGRVAPVVDFLSSGLHTLQSLPGYEHLLSKSAPFGREKSAAAANCTVPPIRRRASVVDSDEKVRLAMMTTSYQRHLLPSLQHRLQRTCMYTAIGNYLRTGCVPERAMGHWN